MKRAIAICAALALAACSGASRTEQGVDKPSERALALKAAVDAKAPQSLAENDVPSVAVAYIADERVQWSAVYGEQSPGVPATSTTLYNIASMTKPLAAETVLRLASRGDLSLDEAMSGVWIDPDLRDDLRHEMLTPRIALQHRTGFANWRRMTEGKLSFQFDPGTATGYSGEGYNYVGRFVEKKIGRAFDDIVADEVFEPLGMKETTFIKRDWTAGRIALPQGPDAEWGEPDLNDSWNAADDVYTTAEQYARFLLSVKKDEDVSPTIAAERLKVVDNQLDRGCPLPTEHCPESVGFGLGWEIFEYANERVVTHGGSDWGEKTFGYFVPERGIGVVIFTNGSNGARVIRDISALLYDNPSFNAFLDLQAQ